MLRPLARRVHFLAGVLVAPFLLLLCLTGLVYVFSPQIHDDLYGGQLYVDRVGGAPRPVGEQVAAALAAHPEAELQSVVPPPAPDRTTRVNLSVPGREQPGEARTVYVDPYTNYINGELTTVDGRLPANVWLRDLHGDLHLGEAGRLYSEIAASWLPLIVVGGLALWIAKQGRRPRTARELLVPAARGKGELTRLRGVHGPLGLWLSLGLLAMSATGLMMSRFAGRGVLDAQPPTLPITPVDVRGNAPSVGLDRVLEVARAHGLDGDLDLRPPPAPDRPFTVTEVSAGLPIRRDAVAVDPYSADVMAHVTWDDYPLLAKLRVLGIDAHTGALFGLANQILLALLMVATIVLIVVGYRLWWKRSPYRGRLPESPPRALRGLTPAVAVPVALVAVVLGWLMPVFAASAVAFVVVDLVINALRHRRDRVRRGVAAGVLLAAGSVFAAAVLADPSSVAGRDDTGTRPGGPPDLGPPPSGAPVPQFGAGQAAPERALDAGTAAPTSWGAVAFPDTRAEVPPGVPDGTDGGSAPTPPTGVPPEPGTDDSGEDGADGSGDGYAGGGYLGGPAISGGVVEGTTGEDGAAVQPPPPADGTGVVDGLVGTLTDVARPVTSLLTDVVESVTGGLFDD